MQKPQKTCTEKHSNKRQKTYGSTTKRSRTEGCNRSWINERNSSYVSDDENDASLIEVEA